MPTINIYELTVKIANTIDKTVKSMPAWNMQGTSIFTIAEMQSASN
jgi:hypothetical protein